MCRTPCFLDLDAVVANIAVAQTIERLFPSEAAERADEAVKEADEVPSSRLGLFFLAPHGRQLPGSPLTLLVYEPRYLVLMQRCVETNTMFGVLPGPEANTGMAVKIDTKHTLHDGRQVVTCHVHSRFRLLRPPEEEPGTYGLHYAPATFVYDEPIPANARFVSRTVRGTQQGNNDGMPAPGSVEATVRRLSPSALRALCELDELGAAERLRDACAHAAQRMLQGLNERQIRMIHSAHGQPPGTTGPAASPERWSCWLACALALSPADAAAAVATTDVVHRLLLCYVTLEEIDSRLRAAQERRQGGDDDAAASAGLGPQAGSGAPSSSAPAAAAALEDPEELDPTTGLHRLHRLEAEHGLELFATAQGGITAMWGGSRLSQLATTLIRWSRDFARSQAASSLAILVVVLVLLAILQRERNQHGHGHY